MSAVCFLTGFWLGLAVGFGGLLALYVLREARHGS